jgi:hypothetical protein
LSSGRGRTSGWIGGLAALLLVTGGLATPAWAVDESVDLAVGPGQGSDVTGTSAVSVRSGTRTVTWTASNADAVPRSSQNVVFTLTAGSGLTLADLTANDVAVPPSGQVLVRRGVDGVAALAILSRKTASGNTYTVSAGSSGIAATYTSAVADRVSSSGTAAVVGTTATLEGRVLDQWGQGIDPGGRAVLSVQRPAAAGPDISRRVDIKSNGRFAAEVADVAGAGRSPRLEAFTWTAPLSTGPSTLSGVIHWVASMRVAATAFTGLGLNSVFPVPAGFRPPVASQFGPSPINVTGIVKARAGAATDVVPYAPFTLTGTPGVTFMDGNGVLSETFTGLATADGLISDGVHAYVRTVLTRSGVNAITLKSGSTASATTGEFTTANPVTPWKIDLTTAMESWGVTVVAGGKVTDVFGNAVPSYGVRVDLVPGPGRAQRSLWATTDGKGLFNVSFTAASVQRSTATVRATLTAASGGSSLMTADPSRGSRFATSGLVLDPHGSHTDTVAIAPARVTLTLTSTPRLIGAGRVTVSGKFMPLAGVDIYVKPSGANRFTALGQVETDARGGYSATFPLPRTARLVARAAGLSSKVAVTKVYSSVTLTAESRRRGYATLSANGSPSVTGRLTFRRSVPGKDPVLRTMTSNAHGNGRSTVKLPTGNRSVYVTFQASGTGAGRSRKVAIEVE